MKKTLIILLFIVPACAFAQTDSVVTPQPQEVFVYVEETPSFPGGEAAMMKFISDKVEYPEKARKNGIEGKVVVQFIVDKDGSVTNANIKNFVDPLLDAEALRVVKLMPKWRPGKQNGKPVRTMLSLPISFKLN